jgi:hypothetical protein
LYYTLVDNKNYYLFVKDDFLSSCPNNVPYDETKYYEDWLVWTTKKSDGKYPRLKYFENWDEEKVEAYLQDLLYGRQTSNYFTTIMNQAKAEIDKLYL